MRHTIKMLGLVSALALSACGPDGNGENGIERFVGTWKATAGTVTTACPGYQPSTDPITGTMVWNAGISSDLATTDPGSGCVKLANVSGSTATGLPGQTCTGASDAGAVTLSLTGYTFVVSPDGRTATENQAGTLTLVVDGVTVVCSITGTGSYQKISN